MCWDYRCIPPHLTVLYVLRDQIKVTRLARQMLLCTESSYQTYVCMYVYIDKVMMHEDMSRNYTFMITKAVDFVNNCYPEILNSEYSIRKRVIVISVSGRDHFHTLRRNVLVCLF